MTSALNNRKKVLIITYYWPPSGGSPVLRCLKFVKYLRDFGWEPTVYTPKNPLPQAIDESLLNEIPENITIVKQKIKEPYQLFKFLSGKRKEKTLSTAFISEKKSNSKLSELAVWIRGNIFIPDARMLWIRPSVRFLTAYLKEDPHDAIISSGPPHSMHLIARGVKKKLNIPWLADFRDPWTNIDFYRELKLTRRADRKHHRLERSVLNDADTTVTIGPTMSNEFRTMGAKKVATITNGFDEIGSSSEINPDKNFVILHVGSMPKSRNPVKLWEALGQLVKSDKSFQEKLKIELIGNIDYSVLENLKIQGLESYLIRKAHLPNQDVIRRMQEVSILLLVVNNTPNASGILTNKFFEYLSARRPVLAIGPKEGDAGMILKQSGAGKMFDYEEVDGLRNYLSEAFTSFLAGNLTVNVKNIDNFSRRQLTAQLAEILDSLVS